MKTAAHVNAETIIGARTVPDIHVNVDDASLSPVIRSARPNSMRNPPVKSILESFGLGFTFSSHNPWYG